MRTIDWVEGEIHLIDQTRLPDDLVVLRITELDPLVDAIERLAVRGAPALGVAGAMGVAQLAARYPDDRDAVIDGAARLRAARPTAVNLGWGVDRAIGRLRDGAAAVLDEALRVRDEDIAACAAIAERGADLIGELVARPRVRAMTICNTGALAAVERGTALGVIGELHARGALEEAFPLETRPLLQGARVPIEERGSDEVTAFRGVRTSPAGTRALNPAFDVTPASLITAIVTDRRSIRLDRGETPGDGSRPA